MITVGHALIAIVLAVVPGQPVPSAVDVVRSELIVTTPDGLVLPATLHTPAGARTRLPGIVLVHGSGPTPRERLRAEAEAFARSGIATLTYDKRTVGYSFTQRSYSQLADDAVAAAAALRGRAEVDPAQVGLWGLSEGGWVAPIAATRDPHTAFLVVVGANGIGPLRQQVWADATRLERSGVRGSLVDTSSRTLYRLVSGLGVFPEPYHDPGPVLRELTLPVLGIWGALDRSTPPVESTAAYDSLLREAGNRHYTLRTLTGAEHSGRASTSGYDRSTEFAPGYVELVGSWVAAVAAGVAPPTSVAGSGDQARPTAEAPPLGWYESIWVQAGALVVMLAGFIGPGTVAGYRRVRGRVSTPAPWSTGLLMVNGLGAVLGCLLYLGFVMTSRSGAFDPGPMIAGRPLPWLALQALAVTATGAAIALAVRIGRHGGGGPGAALVLCAGAVFVPWSVYWGLLVP
ncbi:alpha/beta hydrolase family protein [Pseudonocardia sp. TRM90224]|uniref:alpha/beta hydrolase family protein n=1 Tax=Pseudonocardia sp. TRM90224 TaxID=2812678 RepID=UPI001E5F0DFA|nr:prolyl oligopeptidase family serine peptidase [Pseudonocardia sp. TRM90224]